MACINTEPGGRRAIQFIAADGKRRSIRLGRVSGKQAEAVKVKVEQLVPPVSPATHLPTRQPVGWRAWRTPFTASSRRWAWSPIGTAPRWGRFSTRTSRRGST